MYISIHIYEYMFIFTCVYIRSGDGTSATRARHDQ